jgi:hypothetical protein
MLGNTIGVCGVRLPIRLHVVRDGFLHVSFNYYVKIGHLACKIRDFYCNLTVTWAAIPADRGSENSS